MTEILDRIASHLVGLRMPRALEALAREEIEVGVFLVPAFEILGADQVRGVVPGWDLSSLVNEPRIVNNPLTGVLTFSSLLLREAPEGSELHESLDTIVSETKRCREIVKSLLDFSRQTVPKKRKADINQIIHRAATVVENRSEPVAKRRRRVMFSGPWPVRRVQRSSSQFQSRM